MTDWNSHTSSPSGSDMSVRVVFVWSQSVPPSSLMKSPHTIGGFMLWNTYSSPCFVPTTAPKFAYHVTSCVPPSVKVWFAPGKSWPQAVPSTALYRCTPASRLFVSSYTPLALSVNS